METIFNLDYYLLDLINQKLSNPFFDFFLKWIRNEFIWGPLYIFIIGFLIYNFGRKAYWVILLLLLTFANSDIVSSHIIKKSIKRERPCRNTNVPKINVRVRCGSAFSFTSSHATNHFAIATFLAFTLGKRFKRIKWPLWIWAAIICLAQVYVGVHFPLDVFCGAILGFLIGWVWSKIHNHYFNTFSTSY